MDRRPCRRPASGPLATAALLACVASSPLAAQGITSAAIDGVVRQQNRQPVRDAAVRLSATASGARWDVRTDGAGRYFIENVEVGGPYVVEVRALGFAPARRSGIVLALGQRLRADFIVEWAVPQLDRLVVTASADPLFAGARVGPTYVVSETDLGRLPNLSRDLGVATALSPLAVPRPLGGISVGGQNQSFNSLQVDGGLNADLYLGRAPGGASPSAALPEVLPHAISLETVREVQVLAAPFDVRMGSFAGGLINAVTKSGTNDLRGSAFAFLRSGRIAARGPPGQSSEFTSWQFGGTLSGPILRDRAHFLVNADLQRRVVPDPGPISVDTAAASRFARILADSFALTPGSLGPSDGHLPARDLFAKVTVHLRGTGRVELSHHHAHADRRNFMDAGRTLDTTGLTSAATRSRSTTQTSRVIWGQLVGGRVQSELIASYARLHDSCQPNATFPLIQVNAAPVTLIAGPNSVCPTTNVVQSALELTENMTIGLGPHVVTLGVQGGWFRFRDPLVQVSAGRWDFANLDSLARGVASHYDRGLPSVSRPPGADFEAFGLALYAQDRWALMDRASVTVGLRLDVPFLPRVPATNPVLQASLGVDTGRLPSGNATWSPRLSLSYDVNGDGSAYLRGGVGLFSGPPPYRWLGNAYRESGDERVVICDGARAPPFDPREQPSACVDGTGTTPRISYFDPVFRFPQNLKAVLGADRRLPWGVVAAIDFLYTRAVHQVYISNTNLSGAVDTASGEEGRHLYGSIAPTTGLARPAWRDASFGEVYRVSSRDGDHGFSLSAHVRRSFGQGGALHGSYSYSRTRDRMSLVNFPTRANFSNTPLDRSLDDRRLRPSFFDTPHKIALAATIPLPRGPALTLYYVGWSQPPYTYVINGDANADGIGGSGSLKNDAVYVPLNADDISLTRSSDYERLDAFIERQPCLREQRGQLVRRGSCRNGWLESLDSRLVTAVPLTLGRRLELTVDVFNVPNLLNARWGRHRDVTIGPSVTLLRLAGWDAARDRGVYRLPDRLPFPGGVDDAASRWRAQLGARYVF